MSGMGIDFSGLASILFLLLALYGCSLLFGVVQGWIMARRFAEGHLQPQRQDVDEARQTAPQIF